MKIDSPAKINLFLHVLGKMADGYHELYSLMTPIDLKDELGLCFDCKGIRVVCDHPGVPGDETNLAHRAAALFMDQCQRGLGKAPLAGVEIRIRKNIPLGGGLGGGSSNAASVLMALNERCGNLFDTATLMEMGVALGADVPFFLLRGPAFARGRGEKLARVDNLPGRYILLCDPGVAASTARVFKNLDLGLTSNEKYDINPGSNVLIRGDDADLGLVLHNDLEETACRLYPEIWKTKKEMEMHLGQRVCMSGSGASLFALFSDPEHAQQGHETLSGKWCSGRRKVMVSSFQV